MPTHPNPHSKTNNIVLKGNQEREIKIRAFKEICARNGLDMSEILYEYAVERLLIEHNWPPGNSQTVLASFGVQTKITQQCEYPGCKEVACFECVPNSPLAKPKVFYCKEHREHAERNRLLKKSKKL